MKNVSELTGPELAYWAARAQGFELLPVQHNHDQQAWRMPDDGNVILVSDYQPQDNWAQCGALIEEVSVSVTRQWRERKERAWLAVCGEFASEYGENPKEAICRCVVASVYGEFVPSEGEL